MKFKFQAIIIFAGPDSYKMNFYWRHELDPLESYMGSTLTDEMTMNMNKAGWLVVEENI